MTDQELIAYLRLQGLEKDIAAADLIEELKMKLDRQAVRLRAAAAVVVKRVTQEREETEAKLTKAMEALQVLSCKCTSNCYGYDICPSWTIRTVLAELEGKE